MTQQLGVSNSTAGPSLAKGMFPCCSAVYTVVILLCTVTFLTVLVAVCTCASVRERMGDGEW